MSVITRKEFEFTSERENGTKSIKSFLSRDLARGSGGSNNVKLVVAIVAAAAVVAVEIDGSVSHDKYLMKILNQLDVFGRLLMSTLSSKNANL